MRKLTVRKLVTLPADTNVRVMKFADRHGLSISGALCMLITGALNRIEAVPPTILCGCDETATCANAIGEEHTGQCRWIARRSETKDLTEVQGA